jgi:ribonuclease HI
MGDELKYKHKVRGLKVYVDANPKMVAYVVDGGPSSYRNLEAHVSSQQAEYIAVSFAISEIVEKYSEYKNKYVADGRKGREEIGAILVLSDNKTMVEQLNRNYHINSEKIRELAQQVWGQVQHMDVKFEWVPREENLAGKMLK